MSSSPAHVAAASSGLLLQSDPLHRACRAGRWAEVQTLIDACGRTRQARSFYVNRRDANGSSPIFHCVWYGFYRVLALLLYQGANPNLQNNRRNTALHLVCEQMHWSCAGLLLQAGARIDIVNGEGKTCLQAIPAAAERHDAAEFAAYIVAQHHVYARESACRADLFEMALPPPPPLPAQQQQQQQQQSNGAAGASAAAPATRRRGAPEHEAIRRLCWSIQHLEKGGPAASASSHASAAAASSHAATARPASAHTASATAGGGASADAASVAAAAAAREGVPVHDESTAQLDPDLLAPIQAILWNAANAQMQAGGGGSAGGLHSLFPSGAATPQPTPSTGVHAHLRPHHRHTASTSSAMSGCSATSARGAGGASVPAVAFTPEAKAQLISSLQQLHRLALRFPPSHLGPGLEERHNQTSNSDPAPDADHNGDQRAEAHGPALSGPGLAHFVNHLATHWTGLPLPYKKFMLSYLIRFAGNVSNAAALLCSTRPVALSWLPSPPRPAVQSVLERLVDAVLDWLELQRGLSSAEPECSLLPPSKTFCSVAATLGSAFPAQANPLTSPLNAGTAPPPSYSSSATPIAGGASRQSMAPSPRRSPATAMGMGMGMGTGTGASTGGSAPRSASPSDGSGGPSFGAAFAGLVAPSAAASAGAGGALPPSPSGPNPFVPAFSYVDDYEVASLLLELVASTLCTLRTQAHRLTRDMLVGGQCPSGGVDNGGGEHGFAGRDPAEAQRARDVSVEERAANGLPKQYSTGGGGGCGMLTVVTHPAVAQYGQSDKEGVHDCELERRMDEEEMEALQRIERRMAAMRAAAPSPFDTRAAEAQAQAEAEAGAAAGNLLAPGDDSDPSTFASSPLYGRAVTRLWRLVVRLFEEGSSSPVLRLCSIVVRAPFPPMVHPLLSLRTLFLWREGFAAMSRWHPRVCDAFRSDEIVTHTLVCLRNVQHLLRPSPLSHGMRAAGAAGTGAGPPDKDDWKRALLEALNADTAQPTIEITSPQPKRRALLDSATSPSPSQQSGPEGGDNGASWPASPVAAPFSPGSHATARAHLSVQSPQGTLRQLGDLRLRDDARVARGLHERLQAATAAPPDTPPSHSRHNERDGRGEEKTTAAAAKAFDSSPLAMLRASEKAAEATAPPSLHLQLPPQQQQHQGLQQGLDTTRELHAALGIQGPEPTSQGGAYVLLQKMHVTDAALPLPPVPATATADASTSAVTTTTKKTLYMPHLRTEVHEPEPPAFPLTGRKQSLRTSPSQTALELASPLIQGAAQSLANPASSSSHAQQSHSLNSRAVSSRLRSVTMSQQSRHKLSTKEVVMRELAAERQAAERAEALRLQLEEITVLRIGDPTKLATAHSHQAGGFWGEVGAVPVVGGAPSALTSPTASRRSTLTSGLAPLALSASPSARGSPPGSTGGAGASVPPSGAPQNSSALSASALPDFYSAATIAARLMLVDRGADFILALVLDSARRAQVLAARKSAAVAARQRQQREAKAKEMDKDGSGGNGAVVGGLGNGVADAFSVRHPSTGNRSLRACNDLYGPPALTGLCASLMNLGVIDYLMLLLSPHNQSLSVHRHVHAGVDPTNSDGVRVVGEEDENIGVHQSLQCVAYLLRMDAATELMYRSPHALAVYAHLASTSDEHVASSALYVLSHLLRKREWNRRLLALRGKNPNVFLTHEEAQEEVARAAAREQRAQRTAEQRRQREGGGAGSTASTAAAAAAAAAAAVAESDESSAVSLGHSSSDSSTPHVPLEFLLMKWARIGVHLSLTTLELKPWSTWPRSTLLRRLPSAPPGETPVRALVYPRDMADPVVAARVDRQRAADQQREWAAGAAKRARRLEQERVDQEEADRTFLTALGANTDERRENTAASDDATAHADAHVDADATSLTVVLSPPSAASSTGLVPAPEPATPGHGHGRVADEYAHEHALSSSSIPPSQSWFAHHYTPPTSEQKQYARQLQRAQERKMAAAAGAGSNVASPNRDPSATAPAAAPQTPPRPELASPSSSGGTPALFTPIADFSGTAESEAYATSLYASSSAARIGVGMGFGAGDVVGEEEDPTGVRSNKEEAEARALDRDVNTLVMEQLIMRGTPAPANKARTLRALVPAAAAAAVRNEAQSSLSSPSASSRPATAAGGGPSQDRLVAAPGSSPGTGAGHSSISAGATVIGIPGGVSAFASAGWSSVSMSESLLYRVVQCLGAFLRTEDDAARLLECGALELLAGLVNHPVFDISLHALRLLVTLSTRFSEDFLVSLMETLTRRHLVHSWMGVGRELTGERLHNERARMQPRALARAHENDTGFPWPTLDTLVSSAAEFLRVDVSFGHGSAAAGGGGGGEGVGVGGSGGHGSDSHPVSPLRDERSALAFQLLVSLCQDPVGRGYAAVQSQAVWFSNLLTDVLAHPSLRDLEERQRRYRRAGGSLGSAQERFPFAKEREHMENLARKPVSPTRRGSSSNLHLTPTRRGSQSPLSLTPSSSQSRLSMSMSMRSPSGGSHLTPMPTGAGGSSRTNTRATLPTSPKEGLLRPASAFSLQRRASLVSGPVSPSQGSSGYGASVAPRSSIHLASALAPSVRLLGAPAASTPSVVPVSPFGGHWSAQGGVPLERHYAGGTGFPLHAPAPGGGLDWELPSAAAGGSTELMALLADSQLSTQPVSLRVCGLASCASVEHVQGSFVVCARCQQVAYCCAAHRRLAWRSWHERVCSVTKRKVQGEHQTRRYPVRTVERRMHSSLPAGIRNALLAPNAEDE